MILYTNLKFTKCQIYAFVGLYASNQVVLMNSMRERKGSKTKFSTWRGIPKYIEKKRLCQVKGETPLK